MLLGELAAIASAAVWALSSVVLAGLSRRLPGASISALRLLGCVLFYLVLVVVERKVGALTQVGAGNLVALAGSAMLGVGAGDTLYIISMNRLGIGRASTISIAAFPFLAVLLAWLVLGETLGWRTLLAAPLIVGGIALVLLESSRTQQTPVERAAPGEALGVDSAELLLVAATVLKGTILQAGASSPAAVEPDMASGRTGGWHRPFSRTTPAVDGFEQGSEHDRASQLHAARRASPWIGVTLALTAAVAWAVATIWIRTLSTQIDLVVLNSVRMPIALALVGGLAAAHGELRAWNRRPRDLALVLVAGVVGTGGGTLAYVYALAHAGAAHTALLNSITPVLALPLGVLFLHERLQRLTVAGAVIALAGVWLIIA